jgi:hypothetical protein
MSLGADDQVRRKDVEEALFLFASDLPSYLEMISWDEVEGDKETFLRSFRVLDLFRMSRPTTYCFACVASDSYYIDILLNRILGGHPILSLTLANIEVEIGSLVFPLPNFAVSETEFAREHE